MEVSDVTLVVCVWDLATGVAAVLVGRSKLMGPLALPLSVLVEDCGADALATAVAAVCSSGSRPTEVTEVAEPPEFTVLTRVTVLVMPSRLTEVTDRCDGDGGDGAD